MDFLIIKKIISAFLIPPGVFVLILFAGGVVFLRRGLARAAAFAFLTGALLWAAATGPVTDRLLSHLEGKLSFPSHPAGDVIILLGGGIYEEARDLTGIGVPGEEMMYRLVTAARLQKRLGVPIIVSGGSVVPGRLAEAGVVRRFLVDLGVPAEKIILEEKSRDTTGNAMYCREICRNRGFRSPLLVTSGYHMPRSLMAFGRAGLSVIAVPAHIRAALPPSYVAVDYLPWAGNLAMTSAVIREELGILFYRLGGR